MADAPSENQYILIDQPARFVQRITLNRPEKRNAMSNDLRIGLFRALEAADIDDGVRVIRSEEHTSELQSLMRISYAACGLTTKRTRERVSTLCARQTKNL